MVGIALPGDRVAVRLHISYGVKLLCRTRASRSEAGSVESSAHLVQPVLTQVSVCIRRGTMSQHLLHDLDVGAAGDGEVGGGVPQLVTMKIRNAARLLDYGRSVRNISGRRVPRPPPVGVHSRPASGQRG